MLNAGAFTFSLGFMHANTKKMHRWDQEGSKRLSIHGVHGCAHAKRHVAWGLGRALNACTYTFQHPHSCLSEHWCAWMCTCEKARRAGALNAGRYMVRHAYTFFHA